ncbi:hypothetical protein GCM10022409_18790 [Hymenobacter glaciei]|uniref:Uncharacterized protein n=1 Tax=Hymenobacter glaciei TaxID=877209 RepID=A0ABP7U3Z5_9BACT
MECTCSQYRAFDLDRRSIYKRIKATPAILKLLLLLAESGAAKLKLLQCPHCGQFWQTGREMTFGNGEYGFQVPAIIVEEWRQEPYLQPAAWMLYGVSQQSYYAANTFEPSDMPCGVAQCPNRAIRGSGVCEHHHIEQLQQFGLLRKRPEGRLFHPYNATAPA